MASARSLLSGWRASATGLLLTTLILTITLISLLLASLYKFGNGWASLEGTSQFFSGDCERASRLNLGLHLVINITGSIILASSNFFMQILLAPTRSDVDKSPRAQLLRRNRRLVVSQPQGRASRQRCALASAGNYFSSTPFGIQHVRP